MTDFPRDAWPQWHYPRLRGYSIGEDGEVTTHLCLGLPCCGLDLLIEHPPSMTALDLYRIAAEFCEMHRRVKELPAFQVCQLPAGEAPNNRVADHSAERMETASAHETSARETLAFADQAGRLGL